MGLFCYIELEVGAPMDFGMQSFAIGAYVPARCIIGFPITIISDVFWHYSHIIELIYIYDYIIHVFSLDPLSEGDLGSVPLTQAMIFR